ncbi:MAG: molybdate ABC transporter permease subunit [Gammaproteobacteria bacterium]|nr:molybdate ABC transporter permease subunit [Gammaproteobacteria bacterium]
MFDFLLLSPLETQVVVLSLKVALLSLAINLPLAVAVAYLLARYRFPGKSLLNALVYLPLVLPPVVTGYLLLLTLGTQGPVGAWLKDTFGIVVAFRWTGAAIAAAVMGFPLAVGAIRLSIDAVDRRIEDAASTLGANRAWIFLTITLPLILPGIITGAILAFARALGEFGATITFVANIRGETQTLPLAIYSLTQVPGKEMAALRLLIISVLLSFAALIASEVLHKTVSKRMFGHGD